MRRATLTAFCLSLCLMTHLASAANTGLNPSRVDIKLHKMWLSSEATCASPTLIFDESNNATYRDFAVNPTLGQVNVNNGTYRCVIFQMSDQIKFRPAETSDNGQCVAGTEYTIDVFRGGETSNCPEGLVINGNTSSEDLPCVYVSRSGTADPSSPFDSSSPFLLGNDWTVSADREGTFVTDFNGKVEATGQCDVQAPDFDYR